MTAPRIAQGRFLDDSEVNFLRFGLRGDQRPRNKRALQTLCEWNEAGRMIRDPSEIRQQIHSHLGDKDPVIRSWAMKALALIGHPDDSRRIAKSLRVEENLEAQSWGAAALLKGVQDRGLAEVCEEAGLPKTSAITLAARLYAAPDWIKRHGGEVTISLSADELSLKWAIFLIAYDKAPIELFHPRHGNDVFLGQLNQHGAADLSEYSVWALWNRREFDAGAATIPLHAYDRHPASVRKWLYRLATQSAALVGFDADGLAVLRRGDDDARSREGLALGVADLDPALFSHEVLEWYTVEDEATVRENLLASMALRSGDQADYQDVVERRFAEEGEGSPLRRRLLAASVTTPAYARLQRILAAEQAKQGLLFQNRQPLTINTNGGDLIMGNSFSSGRDINAQNLAGGDMIDSANSSMQRLERNDELGHSLAQLKELLRTSPIEDGKGEVAAAADAVAAAPTEDNKRGLVAKLQAYGQKAAMLGTAVGALDKLIESFHHLIG